MKELRFEVLGSHGFQAAGLVLPAGEEWSLGEGGSKRIWCVHTLWHGELGRLHLSFGPFWCLFLSNMEDQEGSHRPAILPEVSIL